MSNSFDPISRFIMWYEVQCNQNANIYKNKRMQRLQCFCFYFFLGPLILTTKYFEKLYKHFIKVLIQMKWLHRAIPNTRLKTCISLLQRLTICSVKGKTECLCLSP